MFSNKFNKLIHKFNQQIFKNDLEKDKSLTDLLHSGHECVHKMEIPPEAVTYGSLKKFVYDFGQIDVTDTPCHDEVPYGNSKWKFNSFVSLFYCLI